MISIRHWHKFGTILRFPMLSEESRRHFRTMFTVAEMAIGATCFAIVVSAVILAILLLLLLYALSAFV
jgi:hypothetical protein